jgi:hypothetical protein
VIPLGFDQWELQQHPETGAYFVDDIQRRPSIKPRYVAVLEQRKAAIPREQSFGFIFQKLFYFPAGHRISSM